MTFTQVIQVIQRQTPLVLPWDPTVLGVVGAGSVFLMPVLLPAASMPVRITHTMVAWGSGFLGRIFKYSFFMFHLNLELELDQSCISQDQESMVVRYEPETLLTRCRDTHTYYNIIANIS